MERKQLKRIIVISTVTWLVAGGALAVLFVADVINKGLFQKLFMVGFVLYALLSAVLTNAMIQSIKNEPEKGPDKGD